MLSSMIVGIDEVGRGCWAGPLCVGAVVLGDTTDRSLLKDSKQLSAKKRAVAAAHIKETAAAIGIGWASAKFIDNYGLSEALRYATRQAVSQITIAYDEIILDGTVNFLPDRQVTLLAKADSLIPAVSAGALVAKVARDEYMKAVDACFDGYSFSKHVGYGTAAHKSEIEMYGPTPLHRMSFAPLAPYGKMALPPRQTGAVMQTAGALAESRAADYLEDQGYLIVDRNWKTKWCEIDIIAQKDGYIRFVEVKYRLDNRSGRGLEYVTAKKQRQMKFAATFWLQQNWPQANGYSLAAVEVSGTEFAVTSFINEL